MTYEEEALKQDLVYYLLEHTPENAPCPECLNGDHEGLWSYCPNLYEWPESEAEVVIQWLRERGYLPYQSVYQGA